MPFVGLGTEKLWLCPTLDDSATDISGTGTYAYNGGLATVSDTDNGGLRAYDYDQTAAKAILQDAAESIDDTDSFAISWWVKPSTLASSTNYYVLDCRSKTGGSYNGFTAYFRNTSGQLTLGTRIYRGSRVGTTLTGLGLASSFLNQTDHWCLNWDNSANTWTLYRNAVFVTNATIATSGSAVASGTHAAVGNYSPAPSSSFAPIAHYDDFRVHNRILTQAEITHLATSKGVQGSPSGAATNYNPFRNAKYINKTYQIPRFG